MEIFEIDKISYIYRDGKKALDDVSFRVSEGESLTFIGANGSGKSTLLYILNGILKPYSGGFKAFGQTVEDGFDRCRHRVALLFQNPQAQLFSLSVWDELCFGPAQLGLTSDEIAVRADDILRLLKIEHLRESGPWNLSGGEMKKVALGTCLSTNPDVILLDEPTTGLDPRSQVELIDIIVGLREAGKTIITATHDLGIIQDISDKTIVMSEDHRSLFEGTPWDVIKDTDLLLRANLIHKRPHRHSWYVHEHSSTGAHDHEHVPEIPEAGTEAHPPEEQKPVVESSELHKLRILLDHWAEHNQEHADSYFQWADKAAALGNKDLADILRNIASETKKMNTFFEMAKKYCSG